MRFSSSWRSRYAAFSAERNANMHAALSSASVFSALVWVSSSWSDGYFSLSTTLFTGLSVRASAGFVLEFPSAPCGDTFID
eukprot:6214680-Pleurochrysis_carterae.AAC.1